MEQQLYTAFEGEKLLARGRLEEVALQVRKKMQGDPSLSILVFSDSTGRPVDFDLRGSEKEVLQRLEIYRSPPPEKPSRGPGRPKLGVVAREISLLPRHWEWLATQSGGASAALRRLIDEKRKNPTGRERIRQAQERTHLFMTSLAGNLPHFEEALRALYAGDKSQFTSRIAQWPRDIRRHALHLAGPVFEGG